VPPALATRNLVCPVWRASCFMIFGGLEKIDRVAGRAGIRPRIQSGGLAAKWCATILCGGGEICPTTSLFPPLGTAFSAAAGLFISTAHRDQDFYFDRDERIIPRTGWKNAVTCCGTAWLLAERFNYVPFDAPRLDQGGWRFCFSTPQTSVHPLTAGRTHSVLAGFNSRPRLVRLAWSDKMPCMCLT